MKEKAGWIRHIFLASLIFFTGNTWVNAESMLQADIKSLHMKGLANLTPAQKLVLQNKYPDGYIVHQCRGNFSGHLANEQIIGLWKRLPATQSSPASFKLYRMALLWDEGWKIHDIDKELHKDAQSTQESFYEWSIMPGSKEDLAQMICGVSDSTHKSTIVLDDKPLFKISPKQLQNNKVVCFSTSDVYNNWDCIAFDASSGRFRLWYRQAYAD